MTMKSKSSQYPFIIPLRSWHSVSTILQHVNKGNRKHYCPYGMKNPHLSIHFHCLTFDQPHLLHILSACNLSASSTSHESIFTYLLSNQAYKSLYALRVIDLFHLRRTSLITFSRVRRVIQKHLVSSRLFAPLWEPRSKHTLPLSASPTSPTALPSLESSYTPPLRAVCVSSHLPLLRSRWSPSDYIVCAQCRPPVRSHLLTHKSENIATSIQAHCFTHLPVFDVNINNFAAWKSPGQHTVCASVVHGLGEPRRAQQKMKMFYSSGTLISSKLSLSEWISIMRFRYTVEFWVNYLLN